MVRPVIQIWDCAEIGFILILRCPFFDFLRKTHGPSSDPDLGLGRNWVYFDFEVFLFRFLVGKPMVRSVIQN